MKTTPMPITPRAIKNMIVSLVLTEQTEAHVFTQMGGWTAAEAIENAIGELLDEGRIRSTLTVGGALRSGTRPVPALVAA